MHPWQTSLVTQNLCTYPFYEERILGWHSVNVERLASLWGWVAGGLGRTSHLAELCLSHSGSGLHDTTSVPGRDIYTSIHVHLGRRERELTTFGLTTPSSGCKSRKMQTCGLKQLEKKTAFFWDNFKLKREVAKMVQTIAILPSSRFPDSDILSPLHPHLLSACVSMLFSEQLENELQIEWPPPPKSFSLTNHTTIIRSRKSADISLVPVL